MKRKAPIVFPEPVLDQRSLLQRAVEDDPEISAHFTLEEDGLLHCVNCSFVTRQEFNAAAHIEVESRPAGKAISPADYVQHFTRAEDGLLHCVHCYFVTAQELNAEAHMQARHSELTEPPAENDGEEFAGKEK